MSDAFDCIMTLFHTCSFALSNGVKARLNGLSFGLADGLRCSADEIIGGNSVTLLFE